MRHFNLDQPASRRQVLAAIAAGAACAATAAAAGSVPAVAAGDKPTHVAAPEAAPAVPFVLSF